MRPKHCLRSVPEFVCDAADGRAGEVQQVQAYQGGGEIFLSAS